MRGNLLDTFRNLRVLVLGDVMLDQYSYGTIDRVNPENPVAPVIRMIRDRYVLGGAGNVAANIASLGARASLAYLAAEDTSQKELERLTEGTDITLYPFYDPLSRPETLRKMRVIVDGHYYAARLDYGEATQQVAVPAVQEKFLKMVLERGLITEADIVVLSDYAKGTFTLPELSQKILSFAHQLGIQTVVDAKPQNAKNFIGCAVIRPNLKEAVQITGIKPGQSPTMADYQRIAEELRTRLNSMYAVVTLGENGIITCDGGFEHHPTRAREVIDVSGAGDTVMAALALSLASGFVIREAARIANHAAGIAVGKSGTAVVTLEELMASLDETH